MNGHCIRRLILPAVIIAITVGAVVWVFAQPGDGAGYPQSAQRRLPAAVSPELAAYREALNAVKLGPEQHSGRLTVWPLIGKPRERGYLTMDEAIEAKTLEVEDTGQVSDVRLRNTGSRPVLIVDGEEVVGAKQNRVFNSSIMVSPARTITAKVSCVEHGRWVGQSMQFGSGKVQLFAKGRQMNSAAVQLSMAASGVPTSDQQGIWDSVAETNASVNVRPATGAMHGAYEARKADLDSYVTRLEPLKNQVGAIFAVGGEIVGLDLFDSPATLALLYPKLIKSYALDAISGGRSQPGGQSAVQLSAAQFLTAARQADGKSYDSLGEGRDLRLTGWKLTGAALVVDRKLVHAAVFAAESQTGGVKPAPMASPRFRQDAPFRAQPVR